MKPALVFWATSSSAASNLIIVAEATTAEKVRSWLTSLRLSRELAETHGDDQAIVFAWSLDAGEEPAATVKMAQAQLTQNYCLAVALPNPAEHLRANGESKIVMPGPPLLKGETLVPTSVAIEAVAFGRPGFPEYMWRYAK